MAIRTTTPLYGGTTGLSSKHQPGINLQKITYTLPTTFTSTDQDYLMALPAFTAVTFLQLYVVTAITGTTRIDLGDTGSATRYISNMATFTANFQAVQALTTMPIYSYTAADKLLIKLTTTPTAGVVAITIGLTDFSNDAPMTT